MNKETIIMDAIETWLRENKIWFIRINGDALTAGIPDLLVCYEGRFVALECKTPVGKATELQKRVMDAIKRSGGSGGFPTSVEEAIRLLAHSA